MPCGSVRSDRGAASRATRFATSSSFERDWRTTPTPTTSSPAVARDRLVVVRAELHPADVADAHRHAVLFADHDRLELARVDELRVGVDDELARVGLELAGGELEVALLERAAHVERIDTARRHARRVEPDAHRVAALADDRHCATPGRSWSGVFTSRSAMSVRSTAE